MQILVLGPPRSGLSVATRLIQMMGAHAVDESNSFGKVNALANAGDSATLKDFSDLNDRLLKSAGFSWAKISGYDRAMFDDRRFESFRAEARDILTRFEASRPPVLAEPRNCLLMPFWRTCMDSPICVHVVRSSIQVAQSLHAQYTFPISFGIALWEAYTVEALHGAVGLPSVLVSHQDLMEYPVATVGKLFNDLAALGVLDLTLPPKAQIEALIDPEKMQARGDETLQAQFANVAQANLFEELQSGVALALDPPAELSSGAREALLQYETVFGRDERDEAHRTEAEIHGENARLRKREELLEEEIRATRKMMFGHEHDIADLMAWVGRLRSDVDFMENSRRWKIGDAIGRLAETFQAIPTPPLRAQDEARQVGEMYDRWSAPATMRRHESKAAIRLIRIQAKKLKAEAQAAMPIAKTPESPQSPTQTVFHELIAGVLAQNPAEEFRNVYAASEDGYAKRISESSIEPDAPLVSIVMLARDVAENLNRSMRSVTDQTYTNWELLVCDHANLAGGESLVRSFQDPRIKYFSIDHRDHASARNQGLQKANGPLIAYLDSGNVWHPGYLAMMVPALAEASGRYSAFSKHLDVAVTGDRYRVKYFEDVAFDYEDFSEEDFVALNSFVHRRELFDAFGAEVEALEGAQDWALALKYTFLQDPILVDLFLGLHYRNVSQEQIAETHAGELLDGDQARPNLEALYEHGLQPLPSSGQPAKVTILAGDVDGDSFSKARNLAKAISPDFDVQLIGFNFATKEATVSIPVDDDPDIDAIYLAGSEFPGFHKSMAKALARIRGDIIYCVEPKLPSLGLALLANTHTGVPVILDAEQSELSPSGEDGFESNGGIDLRSIDCADPELLGPCGPAWERVMNSFALRSSIHNFPDSTDESRFESERERKVYLRQFSYHAARDKFRLLAETAQQETGRRPEAEKFAEFYARFYEATKAKDEMAAHEVAH